MSKWVCSDCQHSNNSHARYCMKCGNFKEGNTNKKTAVTWRCPICKEENNDYATYCRKCGHWLLSENYTATKVEKGSTKSEIKPSKSSKRPKAKTNDQTISKTTLVEIIILLLLGSFILIDTDSFSEAIPIILIWVILIHIVFSVIHIVRSLIQSGFAESAKTLLKHVGILIGMIFVAIIASYGFDNETQAQEISLETITSNAVELEYEDMLRHADGKYKNSFVKLSGEVYHLENGNQKKIMINMSTDPFDYQAVYIKRKEQDQTVIIDDHVEIYGKLVGTIGTTNIFGVESAIPMIESYSLVIQND